MANQFGKVNMKILFWILIIILALVITVQAVSLDFNDKDIKDDKKIKEPKIKKYKDNTNLSIDGYEVIVHGGKNIKFKLDKDKKINLKSDKPIKNATIIVPTAIREGVTSSSKIIVQEEGGLPYVGTPYCKNKTTTILKNITVLKPLVEGCDNEYCIMQEITKEVSEIISEIDEGKCYLDLEKKGDKYEFTVEHFTDFSVEEGQGFGDCLTCCLEWVQGTSDSCVINSEGLYNLSNVINKNLTDIKIGGSAKSEDNMISSLRSGQNFGAVGNDWQIGVDYNPTTKNNETYRGLIRYNSSTMSNSIFNGTITGATFFFHVIAGTNIQKSGSFMFHRVNESNNWVEETATWNESDTGVNWTGAQGLEINGTDFIAFQDGDPEWNYTTSITTSNWYNQSIRHDWVRSWINGSLTNGMMIKLRNESGGLDQLFVIENTEHSSLYSYLSVNITNLNLSRQEQYNFNLNAIEINAPNVTLDCSGAKLFNNKGAGNGILYSRDGGNISIKNCVIEGFTHNYDIDMFNDVDKTMLFNNCTSINGTSDSFSYGSPTVKNFTMIETKAFSITQSSSTNGIYEDITMINCSTGYGTEGCFAIDGGNNNTFRRLNVTVKNDERGNIRGAIRISNGNNITIEDCYVKAEGLNGIYVTGGLWDTIRNCTIENSKWGINTTKPITIINNTIKNISQQGIVVKLLSLANIGASIINNSLYNTGNGSRTVDFKISLSPVIKSGVVHDGAVLIITSAGTTGDTIVANDQIVNTPTSSNNFYLCAGNIPALGNLKLTTYVDTALPIDCNTVFLINGGTKSCSSEPTFMTGNGVGKNYTIGSLGDCDGIASGYQDPTYLRGVNKSLQEHPSMEVMLDQNWANITGNIFWNDDERQTYVPLNVSLSIGYFAQIWNNHFYNAVPVNTSGRINFCNKGEGNFYAEGLTNLTGDCGRADLTSPDNVASVADDVSVAWSAQNARLNVNYSVFIGDTLLTNTQSLSYQLNTNLFDNGVYTLKIIPNDGNFNATHTLRQIDISNDASNPQTSGPSDDIIYDNITEVIFDEPEIPLEPSIIKEVFESDLFVFLAEQDIRLFLFCLNLLLILILLAIFGTMRYIRGER